MRREREIHRERGGIEAVKGREESVKAMKGDELVSHYPLETLRSIYRGTTTLRAQNT